MKSDLQLDLCGIIELCCLLHCKSTLAAMRPGEVLEITLRDSETLKNLVTILDRSGEIVLDQKIEGDRFRLLVRKGPHRDAPGEKGERNVKCGS